MRIKTSELKDAALDWAVAKCVLPGKESFDLYYTYCIATLNNGVFRPSTDWNQGGPIIEREGIGLAKDVVWMAAYPTDVGYLENCSFGDTALIAAMRCYVARKLGDEVDVPKELV